MVFEDNTVGWGVAQVVAAAPSPLVAAEGEALRVRPYLAALQACIQFSLARALCMLGLSPRGRQCLLKSLC